MAVDRKQQVMEAAARSFALFGYKATTMDGVAKIAGVGKGTIYTFFANKEELFQHIMNAMLQEMKRVAEHAYDERLTFFDNLHIVLERLLEFREQHELALKLSQEVREIGTPVAVEALQQMERTVVSYIANQVAVAVERGMIKPCDPEMTAFIMLKLYMALTVEWKLKHEPLEEKRVAQYMRFYLEQGLAPE
ncbi:TetR/AcrR family transcriptional regulator [Paenibacillus chungangensis]|uniref:TetR/AcrR family transcriptional regulator n=1 Tax=Paenibacillus chungangensis TaxID=696535 RepID=A0ABW3HQT0_9BACL